MRRSAARRQAVTGIVRSSLRWYSAKMGNRSACRAKIRSRSSPTSSVAWTAMVSVPFSMTMSGCATMLRYQSGCRAAPCADAKTYRVSPSGKQRIGTMCSRPLRAPMVCRSSIGGGSSYGAATSPWLARNSAMIAALGLSESGIAWIVAYGTIAACWNTRLGAATYNLVHTDAVPLVLAGAAFLTGNTLLLSLALIWVAHIGMDRAAGFGLKYPTRFKDTHLDRCRRGACRGIRLRG